MKLIESMARRAVCGRLESLRHGELSLVDETTGEVHRFGATSTRTRLAVRIRVRSAAFWPAVAFRGTVGAGEAFMAGHWQADDLLALVRLLVLNRDLLDGLERGLARLAVPALRLSHALRANSRRGARRNIADHYDLGNDFFGLFLDASLMYSAAIFEREDSTLEEASAAKLDRIAYKLELSPRDHVIEIGSGWGGFAIHAARHYGCRVTTTTISRAQFELARERVQAAGVADCVTVLLEDYRDLRGQFDKLVSIEMIEAIGARQLPTFFRRAAELIRPDGMALVQCITLEDRLYPRALKSVDFIQRHIFPGSFIPSLSALGEAASEASDLRLFHLEDLGSHYARTLAEWRRRFLASRERLRAMGHDEAFLRKWEFYFAYCEGGFRERSVSNVQLLWTRPLCRREPLLPRLERAAPVPFAAQA